MMKSKTFGVILSLLIFFACVPKVKEYPIIKNTNIDNKYCEFFYKNSIKNIEEELITSIKNDDTIRITKIKYMCQFMPHAIKKIMYDAYGMWDKALFTEGKNHPILIWKDVQLFKDSQKRYTVYADAEETYKATAASMMVFDIENNSLLNPDSKERKELLGLFTSMIINESDNEMFFRVYFDTYFPEFLEKQKKRDTIWTLWQYANGKDWHYRVKNPTRE